MPRYKIWLYIHDGNWESSFRHHLQQMLWFTMGGFFFGTDIPQRFFPGELNFIFYSLSKVRAEHSLGLFNLYSLFVAIS